MIATAEDGVIKKVGKSGDWTIDPTHYQRITIVLGENEFQVVESWSGQAGIF
jgi:hypothetical protein